MFYRVGYRLSFIWRFNMANHPIFYPIFHGETERVKAMLDASPEVVSVRDAKGLTPLQVAASRGKDQVVQLLLEHGADINGPSPDAAWTPLVFASYRGHIGAVMVLLEHGADPSEKQGNPIHYAGQRGHKEICKLLVAHGAVDDILDSDDSDVLDLFRSSYSYDSDAVTSILSRRPELVNVKDRHGRTPLQGVCTNGDMKCVRVLMECGARADEEDRFGQTALDRAMAHRKKAIVKLLEQYE
jgi:ankyrin repeat protein